MILEGAVLRRIEDKISGLEGRLANAETLVEKLSLNCQIKGLKEAEMIVLNVQKESLQSQVDQLEPSPEETGNYM